MSWPRRRLRRRPLARRIHALCAAEPSLRHRSAAPAARRGDARRRAVIGSCDGGADGRDIEKAAALAEARRRDWCEVANDNTLRSGDFRAIEAIARPSSWRRIISIKRGSSCGLAPFMLADANRGGRRPSLAATPRVRSQCPLLQRHSRGVTDPGEERDLLVQQVTGRVRWRESVVAMVEGGAEHFVEVGGKVLSPLVTRIAPDTTTTSLITMPDLEAFAKEHA